MRHISLIQSLITSYPKNLGFTSHTEWRSKLRIPITTCILWCHLCTYVWLHGWATDGSEVLREFPILGTENILSMTLPYSWFFSRYVNSVDVDQSWNLTPWKMNYHYSAKLLADPFVNIKLQKTENWPFAEFKYVPRKNQLYGRWPVYKYSK